MNSETKRGWKDFQERHGLVQDGDPGAKTLAAVLEIENLALSDCALNVDKPSMRTADGRRIDWIVIHHNGYPGKTIEDIRKWHVEGQGWSDVGYHRIYPDGARAGEVDYARSPRRPGAHAADFNDHSLGYCMIGNGGDEPFDPKQVAKLREDVKHDIRHYGLAPERVIGHREVNDFTGPNDHKTHKHCPGSLFDMDAFRASLTA